MASQESRALDALYRSWNASMAADPQMSVEKFRALFEEWETLTAEPSDVRFREDRIGTIPILWCEPANASAGRLLICFHGGGYLSCSPRSHRKMFGHLAKAAHSKAIIVDYRRAPETLHPGPLEDCVASYRWALTQGFAPKYIALAGDSAGGGLAVATALVARDEKLPLPGALFLMSPLLDLLARGDSFVENADRDLLCSRPVVLSLGPSYVGADGRADDPLASPIEADPTGLPPVLIQTGAYEVLLDNSRIFARSATERGVEITLEVEPEMQHVFHFLAGNAPEADAAIARAGAWISSRLGR